MPAIPSAVSQSATPPPAGLQAAASVASSSGSGDPPAGPGTATAMSFGDRLATLLQTGRTATRGSAANLANADAAPAAPPTLRTASVQSDTTTPAESDRASDLSGGPISQPDSSAAASAAASIVQTNQADSLALAASVAGTSQADPPGTQGPSKAALSSARGSGTSLSRRSATAALAGTTGAPANPSGTGSPPAGGPAGLPALATVPAQTSPSGASVDQPATPTGGAEAKPVAAAARKPATGGGETALAPGAAGTEAPAPTGATPGEPIAAGATAGQTDAPRMADPSAQTPPPLSPPAAAIGVSATAHSQAAPPTTTAPRGDAGGTTAPSPAAQVAPTLVSLAHAADGGSRLTLRLDPAELGHVQIRIDRPQDGSARVEITADRPETVALLQRDQPQLQRALDQAGVPPDGRSLTFHVASQQTGGGQTGSGAGAGTSGQSGGGSRSWTSRSQGRGEDDADTGRPDAPTRWLRAGLDITA